MSLYPSAAIHQSFLVFPFTMIPADEHAIIPPVSLHSTTTAITPQGWLATHLSTQIVTTEPGVTAAADACRDTL